MSFGSDFYDFSSFSDRKLSVCKGTDLSGFQLLEFFFVKKDPKSREETENLRCRSHGEKTGHAEDELGGSLVTYSPACW